MVDRKVVGGLTVLESVWGVYIYATSPVGLCASPGGCPYPRFPAFVPQIEVALVVVLLLMGVLGAWGAKFAFYGGALSSAAFLLVTVYSAWLWGAEIAGGLVSWIGVGLSVLGIVANVLAIRGKNLISEQANPMNLPVFG
jgi:hypothetical protein